MINNAVNNTINNAVNNAVTNVINNLQLPARPRGERGSLEESEELEDPGSITVKAVATPSSNSKWNTIELGYFDPHLNKSYDKGEIITIKKDIYYRSVILFVKRIYDLATVKGEAIIRININIYFRGSILA